MVNIKNCPVCNSEKVLKIREYEYHYPEKVTDYYRDKRLMVAFDKLLKSDKSKVLKYQIYRCEECQFIYLHPRLSDEEVLIKYYWTSDGMGIDEPNINKMNIVEKEKAEIIRKRFIWIDMVKEKRIREHLEKHVSKEARTLLDFGGSDGRMCINLRKQYECEVIELTKHPMREGVKYIGSNFECIKEKEYDIILLIHVLEHVNKPFEYLLKLKEHLKKESGIILISVPLGSLCEWKVLTEPLTHCNFFNEGSLSTLTARAGFNFLEETGYPFSRFIEPQEFGEIYYIGKNKEQYDEKEK